MEFTITITGMEELIEKVGNSPELLGKPLRDFFNSSLLALQRTAVIGVKRDTSNLAGHLTQDSAREIDLSQVPLWARFGTNVPYAPFVEEDTRPHWPPRGALAGWAHRHQMSEFLVRRAIARHGTKGAHMFGKSMTDNESHIDRLLQIAALNIETEWGKE